MPCIVTQDLIPEAGSNLIPAIGLLRPFLGGSLRDFKLVLGHDGIMRGRKTANLATVVAMTQDLHRLLAVRISTGKMDHYGGLDVSSRLVTDFTACTSSFLHFV